MLNKYFNLLSDSSAVAEPPTPYFFFTERHLQAMWLEQKYFKDLKTLAGESIQIISPGIWNQGAGPDFLKAHFIVDGIPMHGDIELHLSGEDWFHHHHHEDERYNDVALHLVLWPPKSAKSTMTTQAKLVRMACLESFLTIPLSRIIQLIDLDLYPYRKFVGSGRCAKTVFRELSERQISDFFVSSAEFRLEQKLHFLNEHISDVTLRLSGGIAMALGYKHNSKAFLDLFQWLSYYKKFGEEAVLALALGACGFFDKEYFEKWGFSVKYNDLKALFLMLALPIPDIPRFKIIHLQIRPSNHPVRRLAYLAKMITDPRSEEIFANMFVVWNQHYQSHQPSYILKKWSTLLPSYEDSYWNYHYAFEEGISKCPIALIGLPLKQEIIINTFLPLLREGLVKKGDPQEIDAFYTLYRQIPSSLTGKSRYLVHRFFGDSSKGEILQLAIHQQGAYQLHKDFCIHYEASCEGCPFVKRYKESF